MILVIEKEKLDFSEAQKQALLALTVKDQIYLVTKKGDTIPVEIIPVINQIHAKLEIKQLSERNSLFEKGFLYGTLSKSAGKDKVVILSAEEAPEGLDGNCVWNEGFGAAKPKKKKSATKTEKLEGTISEKAGTAMTKQTATKAEAAVKRSAGRKKAPADLFETTEYLSAASLIGDKKEQFRDCLASSSDGEIGYKMLLDVNFGRETGDRIWELTKGGYDMLRKLARK